VSYLTGDERVRPEEDDSQFPAAKILHEAACPGSVKGQHLQLPFKSNQDILDLLYKDLAMRVCIGSAFQMQRETSRRELISPVLFAAAALAGQLNVAAELRVHGQRAAGFIDWVYLYKRLAIVVCEVRVICD
jgi:hypothetical protein